ncbi:MAG: hypothetical protein Q9207_005851 [Kuettlingeria erythrocarpa]
MRDQTLSMRSSSVSQRLGAFLVILVTLLSTLLLSRRRSESPQRLFNRYSPTKTALPFTSLANNVVLPFGRYENPLNLSFHRVIDHPDQLVHPTQTINKRARTLTYDNAVCRGAKLYQEILEAFDGHREPGHEFSDDDLENGWSEVDQDRVVDAGWDAAFRTIGRNLSIGDRGPFEDELEYTNLMLHRPFKNAAGDMITPTVTASLQALKQPLTPSAISTRIPPLNRLSDLMWTGWNTVSLLPISLPYILRDTVGVVVDILNRHSTPGGFIGWPGLMFRIDTEEGQALLGTPNGLGTAFLLIDRPTQLGRRAVRVTIFNPGGDYRMLWDMKPPSAAR